MCDHVSILLPNRPGEFLKVTQLLEKERINILGYKLTSEGQTGLLHILCSDHQLANLTLFQKYQYYCKESAVLICPLPHDPGQLRKVLGALLDNEINVEMAYQAIDSESRPLQVFQLADRTQTSTATKRLEESGIAVLINQPS